MNTTNNYENLWVEVGPPNNQSAAFVGRLDNYVFALTKIFKCRPVFRRKVGKFGVAIEIKFIDVVTAFVNTLRVLTMPNGEGLLALKHFF